MTNIIQPISNMATERGQAMAFVCRPGTGQCSYSELEQQSSQLAAALESQGLQRGDRVIVQLQKQLDVVGLYLAVLRLGAVYVPLNTDYTAAELSYFIDDCEPAMIFLEGPMQHKMLTRRADLADRVIKFSELLSLANSAPSSFPPVPCQADDLAAIVYTSGTTGRSKGAMLSHGNLLSNALTLVRLWGFSQQDTLLHALPIYHVHGLFVALHCALLSGCCVHFLERFEMSAVLEELPCCSVMMGVPTYYTRLLASDDFPPSGTSMRLFISGSAPLLAETFCAFAERTGHVILERYGMTEAGMICSNPLSGERIPGTVGKPLPDVKVRIRCADGSTAKFMAPGVLEIQGPNLFKGYWCNPQKTAESFTSDGYFITGDVALMDEQGRISIVGRTKDLIISGGLNVYPKEIEMVIDQYPGVVESAVIGVPHKDFGEAVVAVLVAELDLTEEQRLRQQLQQNLAAFKVPKAFYYADALPRNAMGKVQKNLLRERYSETFAP